MRSWVRSSLPEEVTQKEQSKRRITSRRFKDLTESEKMICTAGELDRLYQAQEAHQWLFTTTLLELEAENRGLVAESLQRINVKERQPDEERFMEMACKKCELLAELIDRMRAQERRVLAMNFCI